MRIFLTVIILILSLQSWTKADDIRDFEIEGISIGDSALDHFKQSNFDTFYKQYYPGSDEYLGVEIPQHLSKIEFSNYDSITLNWKKNDNSMKIVALSGIKLFPNNINGCLKERDFIASEIKGILDDFKEESYEMDFGDMHDSVSYAIDLKIKDGSIRIWCTDWDEKTEKENDWEDDLNVSIRSMFFFNAFINTLSLHIFSTSLQADSPRG